MTSTITTPPPTTAKRVSKPGGSRRSGVGRLAVLLLSPTFIVLGLVVGYPLLDSLRLSFYQRNEGIDPNTGLIQQGNTFVGLKNFADLFTGDMASRFGRAFLNTTTFTIVTTVLETVIGVCMALIMAKAFSGRGLIRASILIPWAIPTVVSALLWRWIFQPAGIFNDILGTQILWSADDWHSWMSVVIADVWKTAPFIGLLTLAGLQTIPADVYEAAKVDGSNAWLTFWKITLPLVKPALIVAILFRLLDVLRMFDLPFVLVGPRKASVETISMLAVAELDQQRFGPAAAIALLLFVYIAVVAFVFVRVLGADIIGARGGRR
jgi:multiple sugar transport system permease protein